MLIRNNRIDAFNNARNIYFCNLNLFGEVFLPLAFMLIYTNIYGNNSRHP